MKSSLRLSPVWMVLIFAALVFVLVSFSSCWYYRQIELNALAEQERDLRSEIEQLDTWGKWTIDYVKVDKALAYLSKNKLSDKVRRKLTEQIWMISRSYSLDPLLILAVVEQESRGNPNARGRMRSGAESGALGLMQVKLPTAQMMARYFGLQVNSEADLMRPEVNVTVGTAYLIRLIVKYRSYKDALIAYNLGHSAVDRKLSRGEKLPTRYYEHVISNYRKLARVPFL